MSAPRTTVPNGAKDFCDVLARVFEAPVPFFVGAGGGGGKGKRRDSPVYGSERLQGFYMGCYINKGYNTGEYKGYLFSLISQV